jgi:hypothetical protein
MPRGTQLINGREYVYEYRSVWNKAKRRSEQKREYIGRMVGGEFVPNKKYLLREGAAGAQAGCGRSFAGATHLFDKAGELLGVAEDLEACFPGMHEEMLSLAYYLALEPTSPLYRFKRWAASHGHPCGKDIPSQRSSELLAKVTEGGRMEFFRRQFARHGETGHMFYDCTSVSSYSEQLRQAKYGKNKDGDSLAQINLALLFGRGSGLPLYYRKLPGNVTDVMTVRSLLAGIGHIGATKAMLVMDRGFYSAKNMGDMFNGGHKFIIGAKMSLGFVQDTLKGARAGFGRRENYDSGTGLYVVSRELKWGHGGCPPRRLYAHIYRNDQLAADEKARFNRLLDSLEAEIAAGARKACHEKSYAKYFEITETPRRGVLVAPKQEAIDAASKNFGFFALLSNSEKDAVRALQAYRAKDMVEKAFSDLKDRLSMRRTSVSSEENMEGRLFLQYIGLIYLSYVKSAMDKSGLFKNYTMQEVFDELDVIEKYQLPGKKAYYGEITEKQRKLYAALGVEPPA